MHMFRNWSKLIVLSIFENSNLDWDLGILENMSKLQHVLVQVWPVLLLQQEYVGMTACVLRAVASKAHCRRRIR